MNRLERIRRFDPLNSQGELKSAGSLQKGTDEVVRLKCISSRFILRCEWRGDRGNQKNEVIVSQVPDRFWTVRDADNFLFESIGQAVRLTGPKPLPVSSPTGTEPQFHLAANNAPVREVLNEVIRASKMKIWIATFPSNAPLTVRGFWETTPMYDPKGVRPEDQPFWIFLRWGDVAWRRLASPEP